MSDTNVWRPTVSNGLHILITTRPNFFNEEGIAVLSRLFSIEEVVDPVTFYFDRSYKDESSLKLYLEAEGRKNVVFIESYEGHKLDFGFIFGGDGSILWSNKYVKDHQFDMPVFTFNMGHVGFLSKFKFDEVDEVLESIKKVLRSEVVEKPFYLEYYNKLYSVLVDENDNEVKHFSSINEIMVDKSTHYANWLEVSIDGTHLITFNVDGLLLCTQPGSTAYNASLNGPFIFPGNDSFVLSAIAPFAVNFKSIVLDKNSTVTIKISENNYMNQVRVSADCNDSTVMTKGQELRVKIGGSKLCLAHKESNLKDQWVSKIAKLYRWV